MRKSSNSTNMLLHDLHRIVNSNDKDIEPPMNGHTVTLSYEINKM